MNHKIGDTITVSGKITIKDEVRKDNKKSKLISLPFENGELIYSRVLGDKPEYELLSDAIKSGNNVTIVGELKGLVGVNNGKVNYIGIDTIALNDENNFNNNQVVREDAKNSFVEVVTDAFEIDKVRLNFIKYDTTRKSGDRYTDNIAIYLDINDADYMAENILNGHYVSLIKAQKIKKEKGEINYYSPVEEFFGGTSPKVLASRGQARPDGKALARVLSIEASTSDKFLLVLTASSGPGIVSAVTGGISPERGKVESKVQIPLSLQAAERLALAIRRTLIANDTSKAVIKRMKEEM